MTLPTLNHVVALSGGKDSTAMAIWLSENEPRDYIYAITPTGDELPDMIAHWRLLSEILGKPLMPIGTGKGLRQSIREERMLPRHSARWCTRKLKIEPYYNWLSTIVPAVSYVGLRADESARQGMIFPSSDETTVRFPLREIGWGIGEVLEYLDEHNIVIPRRTDCARCFHQTIGEWWYLWKDYPDIFAEAMEDEAWVSKERGCDATFRSPQRDTWPASLAELAEEFKKGKRPKHAGQRDMFTGACRVCSL